MSSVTLQIDTLPPRNRAAAILISILSLAERVAIAQLPSGSAHRTFRNWPEILIYMRTHSEGFKSSGRERSAADFLDTAEHPISLTDRNETSAFRLEIAIQQLFVQYLSPDGPLKQAFSRRFDSSPELQQFFDAVLRGVEMLGQKDGLTKIFKSVTPSWSTDIIIRETISSVFGQLSEPAHPVLGSVSVFDPLVVKSEFLGVNEQKSWAYDDRAWIARGSLGLYAVIREARGWSSPDFDDRNIIVRDLLWVSNSTGVDANSLPGQQQVESTILGVYAIRPTWPASRSFRCWTTASRSLITSRPYRAGLIKNIQTHHVK
jgi:hypothetical protein